MMKNSDFLEHLKNRKVFIISPHQDDAILSTGMLLLNLKKYKNVTVVNCFTRAHEGPYTFSARKFLKDSNLYSNGAVLYHDRQKEDKKALSRLGVKIVNLGLEDALFRKTSGNGFFSKIFPEINHIYPTYRWHIMKKISPRDYALPMLKKFLETYKNENACYLAPYGIGGHIDHLITRKVCEKVFGDVILYSDFPYNVRLHNFGKPSKRQRIFRLNSNLPEKNMLIKLYATQFQGLFPDSTIPPHDEIYFVNKEI
jgi:LmbE family N-acetylglucosaminyl deacetylase